MEKKWVFLTMFFISAFWLYNFLGAAPLIEASWEASIIGKIISDDGKPIERAEVKLGRRVATTDSEGHFELKIPKLKYEGEKWLWVSADGFETKLVLVNLTRGSRVDLAIKLGPGADAFGRVVDEKGKPLKGVDIWTSIGTSVMPSVKTDERGRYVCKGLSPKVGEYIIHANLQGYESSWVKVKVERPGRINLPDIVMRESPTGTIEGRVTDQQGNPIPSATIEVGLSLSMSYRVETSSDKNGDFKLDVHEGDLFVAAGAKGFSPSLKSLKLKAGERKRVEFKLLPGKRLSGYVVDSSGNPVEGAYVFVGMPREIAFPQARLFMKHIRTNAQGFFEVEDLPDAELSISVLKKGLAGVRDRRVKAGEELKLILGRGGRIAGTVLDAETLRPIKRILVKFGMPELKPGERLASIPASWIEKGFSISTEEGKFTLQELQPGLTYKIIIYAEGYTPYVIERIIPSPDFKPEDLVIRLERTKALKGIVLGPEGRPVSNATVRTFSKEFSRVISPWANLKKEGLHSVLTSSDGSFEIEAPSGEFYISVEHPEFAIAIAGPFTPETFPKAAEIKLKGGGTIEGHVFSGKEPIEGATLQLTLLELPGMHFKFSPYSVEDSPFELTLKTKTSKDGSFAFKHLIPGRYQLIQMAKGKGFVISVRSISLQVEEGKIISQNLGGWGGATVKGTVTDEEGNPAPNTTVQILVRDNPLYSNAAITDENGHYEIKDMLPGTYNIWANQFKCESGTCLPEQSFRGKIEIPEGKKVVTFDIRLKRMNQPPIGRKKIESRKTGSIRGIVSDTSTRKPIPDVRISYIGPNGIRGEIKSDQDGNYWITGLPPGEYTLKAEREGYVPRSDLKVLIMERGEALFDIHLRRKPKSSEDWSKTLESRPKLPGIWIGFNPYDKPLTFRLKITPQSLELNGRRVSLDELKTEIARWAKGHEDVEVGITVDGGMTWGEVAPILALLRGVINFIPPPSKAGEVPRKLIGSIVDLNGDPVPDVKVEVYDEKVLLPPGMKKPVKAVTSDDKGRFELDGLPIGIYRLSLIREGFMRWETLLPVRPGMMKEIREKFLMIRVGEKLPEFKLSSPFPLELPLVEHVRVLPVFVQPTLYINAEGEMAIDGRVMGKPDISELSREISDRATMHWLIIAADRRAKWSSISKVLIEEMMRGAIDVVFVVEERR
jgi:protocatechuate 3,4-dioxygenase beta subunit/biopolymer transport protein ExbD